MFKPLADAVLSNPPKSFGQRVEEFSLGPSLEGAESGLKLGKTPPRASRA
jgi:hypothetical protein